MGEVTTEPEVASQRIDFSEAKYVRRRRFRALNDRIASIGIGFGGISVIIAILLIFVYLLSEVLPMFQGASIQQRATYATPVAAAGNTLALMIEEQNEIALRLTDTGQAIFFNTENGTLIKQLTIAVPAGATIRSIAEDATETGLIAYGLSDGRVLLFRHKYNISYPNDQRVISPTIEYPLGEQPLNLEANGKALTQLAIRDEESRLLITAVDQEGQLLVKRFNKEVDFLSEELSLEEENITVPQVGGEVKALAIDVSQTWLYALTDINALTIYRLSGNKAILHSQVNLTEGQEVTNIEFLLGGNSLLIADTGGHIVQWFLVRNPQNSEKTGWTLQKIRQFDTAGQPILQVVSEQRRKGFLAVDAQGYVSIFNSTAHRQLLTQSVADGPLLNIALSPRANAIVFETYNGQIGLWDIENQHPEVSWSALWQKVWYESYEEPDYVWQSSAANNDFEPKLSITPLAFGTIKAAFYAMLLAAPLAICGAIFTAHFMAPAMRRKVKPLIELMEALPTVILGFLAGLWLAPFVETHLPGVFSLLLMMPLAILLMSFVWYQLPKSIRNKVPEGWHAALLVPLILLVSWLCISASEPMESAFFGGDMRNWLSQVAGVSFDQRNALVVGLAMGFAIIPTIFSITEDAIFSVPKHLTNGSLALGATPWQTLMRVVLLTASPGIFSALMIGFGRAVGETMIVLMATGNTPIMDWNIFEGMRTLAANIAVEMPESEVGSTHYRVLFLAAFVLFIFTFMFNTIAEIVRQRLRRRYGSL
ncbi:MAG: ABC transporter permease subunit [Pseudomonadales bacterium]|nr:ABC transporter permease subunit [Pseudomonadales bacterium]